MTKHTKTCKELKSARLLFINTFIDYVCNRTFNTFLKVYKDIKKDDGLLLMWSNAVIFFVILCIVKLWLVATTVDRFFV